MTMALRDFYEEDTLRMIDATESKSIREWEKMYPNLWLFIEVTREDESEVYEGKLVATAKDPLEFLELDKTYSGRGIVTLETRGDHSEPQPAFVG
jgi:hypothetical protein